VIETGRLFVISGPSGVGKDTLAAKVLKLVPGCERVVTATTRTPRGSERNGKDYRFLSNEEFDAMVSEGGFLEWAVVHGNRYGTPKEDVLNRLKDGRDLILAIDVQGAKSIRNRMGEAVTIFIAPPSFKELERRLRDRRTENEQDIVARVEAGKKEMSHMDDYDYAVVNEKADKAAVDIAEIVAAAGRVRKSRRH
jgi:guanylate kinase